MPFTPFGTEPEMSIEDELVQTDKLPEIVLLVITEKEADEAKIIRLITKMNLDISCFILYWFIGECIYYFKLFTI